MGSLRHYLNKWFTNNFHATAFIGYLGVDFNENGILKNTMSFPYFSTLSWLSILGRLSTASRFDRFWSCTSPGLESEGPLDGVGFCATGDCICKRASQKLNQWYHEMKSMLSLGVTQQAKLDHRAGLSTWGLVVIICCVDLAETN